MITRTASLALIIAAFAAVAVADGTERSAPYSALDTIRRAEVGTFSPRLRTPEREEERKEERGRSEPKIEWPVRCKFDESRPGTITCEERK